ncbi:hypothetical protein [Providencia stuartii]|uniref:hypothetical protein n=1 Tax=Providencia stuartii TaxID=588 RepID=UPI003325A318
MIQPNTVLPQPKPIPTKLNKIKHTLLSIMVALVILFSLSYFSFQKKEYDMQIKIAISILFSAIYFSLVFFIHLKKTHYVKQWNLELNVLNQEKLSLKRKCIYASIPFIITSVGRYGNSCFALNNNNSLKVKKINNDEVIKLSEIPLFQNNNDEIRFSNIVDYLLVENNSLFINIATSENIKLIILDNLNVNEKNILIKKIKAIGNLNFSEKVQFLSSVKIHNLLNKLAQSAIPKNIFILAINLNKKNTNSGEVALIVELNSEMISKETIVKIHQSPEIENDSNIQSIISYGNILPNDIENIWYSNLTDFEIGKIVYDFSETYKDFKSKLINVDIAFGATNELSELLLISLATEQVKKSGMPQLIANSPDMRDLRVVSSNSI